MAKPTADTDATIEALLQQRAQFEQWLVRLDSAGDKAPPAVRARVRATTKLGFGASSTSCAGMRRRSPQSSTATRPRRGASISSGGAPKRRCEAEVRHAVGEYSEGEWKRLERREQRASHPAPERAARWSGDEIARLAEVQGLIGGAPKRGRTATGAGAAAARSSPRSPVALVPDPDPEPEPEHRAVCTASTAAGEPAPRPGRASARARNHPWTAAGGRARVPQVGGAGRGTEAGARGSARGAAIPDRWGLRPAAPRTCRTDDEPDDGTGEGGRRGRRQDAQVRRMRHPQPADGVVLRALRGGAGRDLIRFR